jgi:hypothetical protein
VHGVLDLPDADVTVPSGWLPDAVEVAGMRSWLAATALVARLGIRRVQALLTRRGNRENR